MADISSVCSNDGLAELVTIPGAFSSVYEYTLAWCDAAE